MIADMTMKDIIEKHVYHLPSCCLSTCADITLANSHATPNIDATAIVRPDDSLPRLWWSRNATAAKKHGNASP